jgi:hypothetical protein
MDVASLSGADALAAAAGLGPFQAVAHAPDPDWTCWTSLTGDPAVLQRRVDEVRAVLAAGPGSPDVPPRVAASLVHLGLAARVLAPVVGAALLTGALPVAEPHQVHLRLAGANPLPLAFLHSTVVPVAVAPAHAVVRHWLVPVVLPLSAAVHRGFRLSWRVLDGNVSSAVAGTLRTATATRPDLGPAADALLTALLTDGPLAGTGRRRHGSFVRHSCCLFYRVPGAGTCGDCILG